ncbi:MAG TPA: hypothetical protein VFW11_21805, partial [Cyclobacteriaceae bacterium]|nr:hypothetical protein [Cyclobacteriaceae bacterium]
MSPWLTIKNNESVLLKDVPVLRYSDFIEANLNLIENESHHCVNYFGFPDQGMIRLMCCVANDNDATILISAATVNPGEHVYYPSFTARHLSFHSFERELHENFGLLYSDHPWLKPLRYAFNRTGKEVIENYPFYQIKSEELHEVGVGPIHAGIIEPGHFRFICNGEQILHLEI